MDIDNEKKVLKDAAYEQFARIGKAISSPSRLEILDLLAQGERSVEVLAKEVGLSVANASQHLQVLRAVHLVEAEKAGIFVIYRLADMAVCEFLCNLRALAKKQLAEVEQISQQLLAGGEILEKVDWKTLLQRIKAGTVLLLDVRPYEEYRAGHISGAISIPLAEMEKRISEFPKEQEIVAYCRGTYCLLANQAVKLLRAQGYQAISLADSIQDWRQAGLPIAVGESKR